MKRKSWIDPFALFLIMGLLCNVHLFAQQQKVTINLRNGTLNDVFSTIEKQTTYHFSYRDGIIDNRHDITISKSQVTVTSILDSALVNRNLEYKVISPKSIVVSDKAENKNKPNKPTKNLKKISGIVKDETGEPIIGANVSIKSSGTGTVTDLNGTFTMDIPSNATLNVSYLGYVSKEINATNETYFNVTLEESNKKLNEVVVIGYGTVKKSDLTGAASQIKSAEITSVVTGNAMESLQGKASGLAIFNDNKPGASPSIRIRGSSSISASNEPLYVVDGFPLMDGNISDINPSDIQSIEVLKDASSTAIYGSRGANGVIMITTKQGTKGAKNITISSSYGYQMPGRLENLIAGADFINFMNAGYTNQGSTAPFPNDISTYRANTNWEKEILSKTARIQNYNIAFDGSSNETTYMLSLGYFNQDGLLSAQGYEKYSLHTNLQQKFFDWLTIGSNSQFTYTIQDIYDNALADLARYGWASEPVKNSDGSYNIASQHNTYLNDPWNPVLDMRQNSNTTTNSRFLSNFYADIQFTKDLKWKTNIGIDLKNSRNYQYQSSLAAKNTASGGTGNGSNTWYKDFSKVIESILTYSHVFDKHRLTATGVYSWQDYAYENSALSGSGFDNDQTGAWDMSLADKNSVTWSSTKYSNKLISFTGRVAYAYNDKYLLTATGRWDGSSRFGQNNKWGFFPSLGLGWRITQESFLKDNPVITDLKLRTSIGVTGNQEIGNYNSLAQLVAKNYTDGTGEVKGFAETIGNDDLKWERTTQLDLGIDLMLWNQVNFNADYYSRHTNNLLYTVPIPTSSGYTSILSNVGEVNNSGLEFTLGGKIIDKGMFKLDASVNFTYNHNKINKLYNDVDQVAIKYETSGLGRILKVGESVDAVYSRKSMGIIKTQEQLDAYQKAVPTTGANAKLGDEMYADLDENGTISSADYICLGSVQPKYFYGLNLNASYKDLSVSVYGQGGLKYASIGGAENSSANGSAWALSYADVGSYMLYGENQVLNNVFIPTKYAYKRMWSTTNTNGNYPTAGAHGVYLSDRTNGNWNYFILKNIQLAYNLSKVLKVKSIKNLALNLNFQNFVTFANHRGYNPVNGDTSNPWAKSIVLGVNAKF